MFDELKKKLLEKGHLGDIIGQKETKEQLKSAMLMDRHVIIVGAPGIGKTTLAKNLAKLLPDATVNDCSYNCDPKKVTCPDCISGKTNKTKKIAGTERFVRVQGSPDLTSEDLLGDIDPVKAIKYGPTSIEAFTPGKIFKANNGILFFDELNRCPEKLQNALLQVLEEGKATIGSYSVDLEANFIFIGTMNPQDTSTEKLSDVFVDRFDLVYMGYPETDDMEREIVTKKGEKKAEFPDELLKLMVKFVRGFRDNKKVEKAPSVRATIGLYERAQANAILSKRKTVNFEDLKKAVISVLAHRVELKPSARYAIKADEFVEQEFNSFFEEHPFEAKGGYL
ncbi:MAG: AAA domain-containing protein [bacterium]|nr:AAA domain-containing protein [bacterium]